ncbi:MAG: cation:proton antiporter [Gemmataceae bacterium]
MHDLSPARLLLLLAAMLGGAKLFGALSKRCGQPAVLGELVAGVVLGASALGWIDPNQPVLRALAELGAVVLLFEIGLETDLPKLLKVGGSAFTVAAAGVVLPFAMGTAIGLALGLGGVASVVAGATLTATSVGITARVLSDFNRLHEPESQVILGAAVIDDVLGLVILAAVAGLTTGGEITTVSVLQTTALALGFLLGTLVLGRPAARLYVKFADRIDLPGTPVVVALILAFALAALAAAADSSPIVGAFAAGLLLRETPAAPQMSRGITNLGHFFVPLFFVTVGAAVDVRAWNPFDARNGDLFLVGGLLLIAAVVGKFLAAYVPFWFKGNKRAIGVGMIPRGEVGLIFAQMGLASGAFTPGLFSAMMLVIMATTFLTPPLLKVVFPPRPAPPAEPELTGVAELVTEA